MEKNGVKLFCGFLLAMATWGCSTESPSPVETPSVASDESPESSPKSQPTERLVENDRPTPQSAAEIPVLQVPVRTTSSQDVEVQPASAVGLTQSVASAPSSRVVGTPGQKAFQDLVEAYRTGQPDQWTRAEAAIHAQGSSVLPTLLNGLQSPDRQTRELASMMLSQVLPNLLYPEDLSQRPDLTSVGDRLRLALQDESIEVRVNVAVALSLMEGEGPKLVPIFQNFLTSELPHVRTMSVVALGGLGPYAVSAIPAMERMSQTDPDPNAKSAAVDALKMLQSQP